MFIFLAFLAANSKFSDPSLDVNDEFRFHLISTVINDLASVLGFAILYGAYFDNEKLTESVLAKFNTWIDEHAIDKQQYLKRMVLLSNPYSFSMSASPRDLIRINWKMSFEHRARHDGFGDQLEASHLFFAKQVVPQLEQIDFEIDHHITSLERRLREHDEEKQNEDF